MEELTQARKECGGSTTGVLLHWTDTSEPSPSSPPGPVQKEHMFEKVVTPSDVGKLNRLVIPKQHAERYFPLDSAAHDKGLLLNFEDRHGKPWRFRYSYWNSSQSYVMTKGWSRFVKEKRLDAGDTVLFGRGVGDAARDRLFIDWKRRPDPPAPFRTPHRHPFYLSAAATRLFAPPAPPNSYIYFRSPQPVPRPVVLDSFPLAHGKAVAPGGPKRVRLFGVNLDEPSECLPSPDLRLGSLAPTSSSFSSSSQGGKNGAIIDLLPLDL